ncbi:MAG: hypothetical protein WDN75_18185 [Bacteroidota bacterium]
MEKISETILKFLRLDSPDTKHHRLRRDPHRADEDRDPRGRRKSSCPRIDDGALFLVGFLFLIFFSLGLAILLNSFF